MTDHSSPANETSLLLMQARYVLRNLDIERPGCGYAKMAAVCEEAAGIPAQQTTDPVAWLDIRTADLDWQNRIIATNPQYVDNNGPENFVALYASSSPNAPAQCAPSRIDKGRAFYLAMYEKDGAIWAANDHKGLWCDMAEDYERRISAFTSPVRHDPTTGPCPTCGFYVKNMGRAKPMVIEDES